MSLLLSTGFDELEESHGNSLLLLDDVIVCPNDPREIELSTRSARGQIYAGTEKGCKRTLRVTPSQSPKRHWGLTMLSH